MTMDELRAARVSIVTAVIDDALEGYGREPSYWADIIVTRLDHLGMPCRRDEDDLGCWVHNAPWVPGMPRCQEATDG